MVTLRKITPEIVEWLDALGATVGISHDGPGQSARGPDPLDNRLQRRHLLALYDRLLPQGRVSFNVVLTDTNHDLRAIADWFAAKLEGRARSLTVEGVVIPYHAEGHECSLGGDERQAAFMRSILHAVVAGEGLAFQAVRRKLDDFFQSLATARHAHPSCVRRELPGCGVVPRFDRSINPAPDVTCGACAPDELSANQPLAPDRSDLNAVHPAGGKAWALLLLIQNMTAPVPPKWKR